MSKEGKRESAFAGRGDVNGTKTAEEVVRVRAYEKFCARNCGPGDAVADWLEAERELSDECAVACADR